MKVAAVVAEVHSVLEGSVQQGMRSLSLVVPLPLLQSC